ncbi:MAG: hypothetical protein JNM77_00750 [Pseudonocardia sp.]|nr:hypothetical protein [Pseudonocardia sp.]
MRRDAQLAMAGLGSASPYRATMLHAEGVSHLLDGDLDRAGPLLAHAFDVATSAGAVPFLPVVLAERGIVAIMRDDWHEARAFADQALAFVQDGSLDRYWTSALVYAFVARCAMHQGDLQRAGEYVARAARLRPLLSYALPVVSAQTLLELAAATSASVTPVAPVRCCAKRRTSSTSGPTSETSRGRQTSCGQSSRVIQARCTEPPRSPRPSYGSCRCCPPTSPWARSASGSTSPGTP